MSIKNVTLKKLDEFIQDSLNKFFFVEPWNELYDITKDVIREYNRDIISDKSSIPDLIHYNKTFNKNECFYKADVRHFTKFPRKKFILRPKFVKKYNPTCTFSESNEAKEKEIENYPKKIDIKNDMEEPFIFKKIPKEKEEEILHVKRSEKLKENDNTINENIILFPSFNQFKEYMNESNNESNKNDKNRNQYFIEQKEEKNEIKKNSKEQINQSQKIQEENQRKIREYLIMQNIYNQNRIAYQNYLINQRYLMMLNQSQRQIPIPCNPQPNKFEVNNYNFKNSPEPPKIKEKSIKMEEIGEPLITSLKKNEVEKNWKVIDKNSQKLKIQCNNEQLFYMLNHINSTKGLDTISIFDEENLLYEPNYIFKALKILFS